MANRNLYSVLDAGFPNDAAAPFLMTPADPTLTYGKAREDAARLAGVLAGLGVEKGDRVVAQVEKSPEAVVLYLACLRAGAIYIPLNTAYTAAEVDYFLGDAEPRVLVCDPRAEAALEPVARGRGVDHVLTLDPEGRGTLYDAAAGHVPLDAVVAADADDVAAILYTSGTTGRAKGAMLSHGNLASNATTLHRLWGFVPGDVLLHALPIFHVHGLFVALHCAMLNGSAVHFLPRFDADTVVELLPRSTVMMGVPTFYVRLLDHPGLTREACAGMRLFVAGSAPLLSETFAAWEARTGHRILERYGMSEAGMITSNPYDGARVPGTVGFPLPDVEVRVCDGEGNALPAGEAGVLEIRGPNVFKGYWRMPEKTAEEFRADGFFVTGDVATIDEAGRVSIVGRAKDLIISGGYNVYPKEIEAEIDRLPGVKESAVIGVPHPDFGEGVTAVVVPDGTVELSEAGVIDALGGRLARFKQPKRVFFAGELPRNAMGKVQKNALREAYADTYKEM